MVSAVSRALATSATYQNLATTHVGAAQDARTAQERLGQEKARAEKVSSSSPPPGYTNSQRGNTLNIQV